MRSCSITVREDLTWAVFVFYYFENGCGELTLERIQEQVTNTLNARRRLVLKAMAEIDWCFGLTISKHVKHFSCDEDILTFQ